MLHSLLLCLSLLGASARPGDAPAAAPASVPVATSGTPSAPRAAARVTLTIQSEAKVRGTEVSVANVARIEGADESANARVAALPLGWCPSPGYSRVIDATRVAEVVHSKAPDVAIVIAGASACRVFPSEERVAPQAIAMAARKELERSLTGRDYELDLVELPRELAVPQGNEPTRTVAVLERAPHASGSLTVPVRVQVDGQLFRTVQTTWNVRMYQTAPVLARAIRAGETLDASMLESRRVEVQDVGRGELLGPQSLLGVVAARDLIAGSSISALDVHRPLVLRSGDLVTLRVRKGGVSAEVRAIARSAGAVGEAISVTVESGREVPAVIVAPGIVELVMPRAR